MNTGFERLRRRYEEQITRKKSELNMLETKLALLLELESENSQLNLGVDALSYAGKGLTEAILEALPHFGEQGVTAGNLRQHLLAHGFQPAGKNLAVSLNTTLNR